MNRVFIRSPEEGDCKEFLDLFAKSKHTLNPWIYPAETKDAFLAYQKRVTTTETKKGFLLCLKDTGSIIGVINLNEIVRGALQGAYLGYYLGSPFEGKGYMAEGIKLVIGHAFSKMKLHRLEANIQPGNLRSLQLVKRLGFRKEGLALRYLKINKRWRDHLRWAITVEDYRQLKKSWAKKGTIR